MADIFGPPGRTYRVVVRARRWCPSRGRAAQECLLLAALTDADSATCKLQPLALPTRRLRASWERAWPFGARITVELLHYTDG